MGGEDHPPDAAGPKRSDHVERAVGPAWREQVVERGVEGGGAQAPRLALVEHGCVGVEPGVERVGAQHAGTESVDGRHRRGLGGPRQVGPARVEQVGAHALLELLSRLLGEGDGQDAVHRHAVLEHGGGEALHHHRRLAGPGAGRQQERAVA